MYNPLNSYINRLLDIGIIFVTGFLALYVRFWDSAVPNNSYSNFIFAACLIYLLGSSPPSIKSSLPSFSHIIGKVSKVWALTFLIISLAIIFSQSGNLLSRIWLILWASLTWLFLLIGNLLIEQIKLRLYGLNIYKKKVAIVGKGAIADELINKIHQQSHVEFVLTKVVPQIDNGTEIEGLSNLLLDEIWIALPIQDAGQLPEIIHQLRFSAASIKYAPDLFTLRLINHGSTAVLGVNMLNLNASPFSGEALIIKSIEDFLISLFALVFLSPLLLMLGLAVKISSPGPILYKQERVGLNGRPFMMLKFRSMPTDIEKNGVHWGNSEGKIVHPFSRWMRRMNLDELPQFINVLLGDMSIVGPRPERTEFIDKFSREVPNYAKKHLVKAGITGWAQIHGLRGDTDLNTRIEYDLFYIENWSLTLDLKIILMTALQTIGFKN